MNSLILIFALQSERYKKKDKERQNENQSKTKKQTNKKTTTITTTTKKNGENLYKCQSVIKFTSISLIWIREIMQIVVFHLNFFGIFEVLLYIADKI